MQQLASGNTVHPADQRLHSLTTTTLLWKTDIWYFTKNPCPGYPTTLRAKQQRHFMHPVGHTTIFQLQLKSDNIQRSIGG
ncbi:hypothetical protein ILYODFUR_000254 [Ilyodon furcidens]|uniref:Uncharacterized protein n=1 Tax=Ilyodon furcidens TaxID=33524 RepID=A0ABV0TF64_9TELE